MTREQIEAWAREGESETLEFKKTTGEVREGTKTLCAMLTVRFRSSRCIPPQRIGHNLTDRQQLILGVLGASRTPLALRHILPTCRPGLRRAASGTICRC